MLLAACFIGANSLYFDVAHKKNEDAFSAARGSPIAQVDGLLTPSEKMLLAGDDSPVRGEPPGFSLWYNAAIFAGVLLLVALLDRVTKE